MIHELHVFDTADALIAWLAGPEPAVSRRGWRYRRRLRPLVTRPRGRALLDRAGLIVGVVYMTMRP